MGLQTMSKFLAIALMLLVATPAFAQTWYRPDGSVAQAATGSNGIRIYKRGNVAKLYDAKGYLGTAVAGPNGTTVRWRAGNSHWTPHITSFR